MQTLARVVKRIDSIFGTPTYLKVFSAVATFQILLLLLKYGPSLGFDSIPVGDVSNYRQIALGILNHDLKPSTFTHGPFYAALAIPFLFIFPTSNPFPWIAAALFALASTIFLKKLIQLLSTRATFVLICFFGVTLSSPLSRFILEGSNNITTYSLVLVSVSLLITRNSSTPENILLALLVCLSFGTRYVDVFLLSPILLPLTFRTFAPSRSAISKTSVAAMFFLTVTLILSMHHFYLGGVLKTPYDGKIPATARIETLNASESPQSQLMSRDLSKVFQRFDQVVVDNHLYTSPLDQVDQYTIYQKMPYLLLAPVGLVLLIKRRLILKRHVCFILFAIIIWILFYATAWSFTAHDIFYGCQRYLMGWILPIGMLSLYSLSAESVRDFMPVVILPIIFFASRTSVRAYDKLLRVPCNIQIDTSQLLSCQQLAESASISGPIPKDNGLLILGKLNILSKEGKYFRRIFLQVNSSHDSFFPKKILTSTTTDGINYKAVYPRLSRENHIWEFKLDQAVDNLRIMLREADPTGVPFRIKRVDTFSF